jgi:hypothetical protein
LVESGIKGRDPLHVVVKHDGRMDGVARGDACFCTNEVASAISISQRYAQNDGTELDEKVIDFACKIQPAQGSLSIEDLLQHLGTGASLNLTLADTPQKPARRFPVGMLTSSDIHRYVGIDKHSHRRPASISASIRSMSAVGAPRDSNRSKGSEVAWPLAGLRTAF